MQDFFTHTGAIDREREKGRGRESDKEGQEEGGGGKEGEKIISIL